MDAGGFTFLQATLHSSASLEYAHCPFTVVNAARASSRNAGTHALQNNANLTTETFTFANVVHAARFLKNPSNANRPIILLGS